MEETQNSDVFKRKDTRKEWNHREGAFVGEEKGRVGELQSPKGMESRVSIEGFILIKMSDSCSAETEGKEKWVSEDIETLRGGKANGWGKELADLIFLKNRGSTVRTWKQPRCPSADEWKRKLQYLYMTEYYTAVKRNAFESILMRWMNLETIIQSEVSQKEKDKYHIMMQIYIWKLAGGGNVNPLQYSCLENPKDRGAWGATVHGTAKDQTWLSKWACMESRKMVLMILSAGQWKRCRHREPTCAHSEGRRGWDKQREGHGNTYITIRKTDILVGNCFTIQRAQTRCTVTT